MNKLFAFGLLFIHGAAAVTNNSIFFYDADIDPKRLDGRPDNFVENYDQCAKATKFYGPFRGGDDNRITERRQKFKIIRPMYDSDADFKPFFERDAAGHQPYSILLAFNDERTHISQGYFYLIDQWFKHIQRLQLDAYVVFAAPSAEECQLVLHMAPCILHNATQSDFRYDSACKTCFPLAADFRWLYVNALLEAGKELVIMADADAFILNDPIPYFLKSQNTVFGLSDRNRNFESELDYCRDETNLCLSTGFVALKLSVSDSIDIFVELLYQRGGWEQQLFNDFFVEYEGAEALPVYGDTIAFANLQTAVDIIRAEEDRLDLAVVHAGGIHGDEKVKKFQCAQLWLP
jgi:hypothetical protein